MRSIRRRLLLLQLSAVVLLIGVAMAGAYVRVRDEFYEMQDYHLEQVALLLLQQAELADARVPAMVPREEDLELIGQIWSENGKLIYSSHVDYPLPLPARAGLSTVAWDEEEFRVFVMSRGGRTVQVAQSLEVRELALRGITLRLLAPLVLLVPLLAAATWMTVARALRPLSALREEVVQRNPASLTPIALGHAPDEVKPLVGSLNDLLLRLADALDSQRRFTADAAHELRTPLTAVKLQFQLLERSHTPEERAEALANLRSGIERAIRLVQQLLTLARLEPGTQPLPLRAVSLDLLARETLAEFTPIAKDKSIALRRGQMDEVTIQGDPEQLRTLLNNLVDNAVRYTPAGGRVEVRVVREASGAAIEVADSGPGIAPAERPRVFDRFYRAAGTEETGSGLGLSIVQRIAQAHGASIDPAQSASGGLLMRVRFDSPTEPDRFSTDR
jgi:two-component system OmpR family sensor kinase